MSNNENRVPVVLNENGEEENPAAVAKNQDDANDAGGGDNDGAAVAPRSARGSSYTAIEDYMNAQAWVKASEDAIHGVMQKQSTFNVKLQAAYNEIKKHQIDLDRREAQRPSYLRGEAADGLVPLEEYGERTGGSLFQNFTKKISPDVIKFMGISNAVSIVGAPHLAISVELLVHLIWRYPLSF